MKHYEIANFLYKLGIRKIVGVVGGGDSFDIINSFMNLGGEFHSTPTEFSAPIIAGSMNQVGICELTAASISIRGPGVIASAPGLYFNRLEDLHSISISESVAKKDEQFNFHKSLDLSTLLKSIGFVSNEDLDFETFSSTNLKFSGESSGYHFTTKQNSVFSYIKNKNEMCFFEKCIEMKHSFINENFILVIGKRSAQILQSDDSILDKLPHFLTPAALPYCNLQSDTFLGVWTGTEQFKSEFLELNVLKNTTIVRVGVMKRELLTLKENIPHVDIEVDSFFELIKQPDVFALKYQEVLRSDNVTLNQYRNKIADQAGNWSAYSVIRALNEIERQVNFAIDVGSFATIAETFLRPPRKKSIFGPFISKFMGTAIPISIGISFGEPNIPIICLIGEGGLAASMGELPTLSDLNLPICLLIFSDGTMHSIIDRKNLSPEAKMLFAPPNFDVIQKMRMPNFPFYKASSLRELQKLLQAWDYNSPLAIFLQFDSLTYAKGVELLR